jgi:hypothetical protein
MFTHLLKAYYPTATSLLLVFSLGSSCLAQGGNGGGTRVIYQSQNGLSAPSSTYIGPGTVSASARGGAGGNPNLPQASLGSHVGTAGDSTYQRTEIQGAGQTMEANSSINPQALHNNQKRPQQPTQQQYIRVRKGNRIYYVPTKQTNQQPQNLHPYVPPQGAATYGD